MLVARKRDREGSPPRLASGRILHLLPQAVLGGCEINGLRLIEGAPDFQHEVLVFDEPEVMVERWQAAGAKVTCLKAWRSGERVFQQRFAEWVALQSAPTGVVYWSVSRLATVLSVLEPWGQPVAVHLGNPASTRWRDTLRWRWRERKKVSRMPVTLVACSRVVADSYRHAWYFRRFKQRVIYNAVSPDLERRWAPRPLPPDSSPVLGMVARLDSIKDHATLIRALALVGRVRPDVRLELVGDGALRGRLEALCTSLGVGSRVRFLGRVPAEAHLPTWDVYVHSTTVAEGMGIAVAEAMLTGLPCVVSDLPVMREICGKAGARYAAAGQPEDWAKLLTELLADVDARRELGRAAQLWARRTFSVRRFSAGYIQVLQPAPLFQAP